MAHLFILLYGALGAALVGTLGLLFWAAGKDGQKQRQVEGL
jgi:hypothetical protein